MDDVEHVIIMLAVDGSLQLNAAGIKIIIQESYSSDVNNISMCLCYGTLLTSKLTDIVNSINVISVCYDISFRSMVEHTWI